MTTADDLIPTVHRMDALGGTDLLARLQEHAATKIRLMPAAQKIHSCDAHGFYVTNSAVAPHQDSAQPGDRAHGMVIVNEGHRLHSRRLDAAGVTEGLPLAVGDVYEHDPLDEHWTTVPDGAGKAVLAFYVTGDPPNGRTVDEIVAEMTEYLEAELPRRRSATRTERRHGGRSHRR